MQCRLPLVIRMFCVFALGMQMAMVVPRALANPPALQANGDARLAKPVTLIGERMYLGELLEALSKQSGVEIAASDTDGAAGDRVAVYLKNVPLKDAMEALWALVSYRHAEWQWTVTGNDPTQYVYHLQRPRAARYLTTTLQTDIQTDFEQQAATVLRGLHQSPEERAQLARIDPAAATILESRQTRAGMALFEGVLSVEDQAALLKSTKQVTVSVLSLPKAGQDLVRALLPGGGIAEDGTRASLPLSVHFAVDKSPGEVVPTLFVTVGEGGRDSYLGGYSLDSRWKDKLRDEWALPGDHERQAVEEKAMPPVAPAVARVGSKGVQGALFPWLSRTAKAAPFCFLAHLPREQPIPDLIAEKSIGDVLKRLSTTSPFVRHKWRSGILLLTNLNYPYENTEEARVPWLVVKKLRETQDAAPGGELSVQDYVVLSRNVTTAQWRSLKYDAEFGSLDGAAFHDLYLWMSREPERQQQIQSERGVTLGAVATELQQFAAEDTYLRQLLLDKKVARVRLSATRDLASSSVAGQNRQPSTLHLAFLDQEGHAMYGYALPRDDTAAQP